MREKDMKKIFDIYGGNGKNGGKTGVDPEKVKAVIMEKISVSAEGFYADGGEEKAVKPVFVTSPDKNKIGKTIKIAAAGAAAAGLCLIAAGTAVLLGQKNITTPDINIGGASTIGDDASIIGGGASTVGNDASIIGGGASTVGDGGAGAMYSVAVYPAEESEENVEAAGVISLTESEASANPLSKYLPSQLPKGFHYGRGSVYYTVMKDGKQYNMLRIEYISGTIPEQRFTEDGGAVAPDLEVMGDHFTVQVTNFKPNTDISIYSDIEEVTLSSLKENGAVYIRDENCYIGVFIETAEPEIILEALKQDEENEDNEKTDKKKIKSDFLFTDDGLSLQKTANEAAVSFLQNDREKLSEYLADPSYNALDDNSRDIFSQSEYMLLKLDDPNADIEDDGVFSLVYEIVLKDSEMRRYLDLGLKKTDDGWKVEYIYLQG